MSINPDCKTCAWETTNGPIPTNLNNHAAARLIGCNEASIRRHKKHTAPNKAKSGSETQEIPGHAGSADIGPDGGEFKDIKTDKPITDWTHVFEQFKLDPTQFEIIGDTVRMSTWQQSKALEDGTRTTVQLYSYRASFRRIIGERVNLPALYAAARHIRPKYERPATDRTTVVVYSDPQIGKVARRGGTAEYLTRANTIRAKLDALLHERNPNRTVLLDGGDGFEGFESGGNPMFTNDLSLAGQMDLYGTELFEFVNLLHSHAPVTVAGVPSNHTAWRNSKQNLGNPQDDLGLFMHKQVQKITDTARMNVTWHRPAPYDESVAIDVPGATIGLVHGNQFGPGQAVSWWEKQTFGAGAVTRADILITGHYHSFGAGVAGRNPITGKQRTWLGAPTLDGGSDWFRQIAGRESDPGLLVFDVTSEGFDLASLTIL